MMMDGDADEDHDHDDDDDDDPPMLTGSRRRQVSNGFRYEESNVHLIPEERGTTHAWS